MNRLVRSAAAFVAAAAVCFVGLGAAAQTRPVNGVTGRGVIIEPPTLISAGFEWPITGDDNRNASVALAYRIKGQLTWTEFLPMMRIKNEVVLTPFPDNFKADNRFAGSLFDLKPATDYEVRLTLSDPDGVSGARERIVQIKTRAEPMPAQGGKVYHVYPGDWEGDVIQPAFYGLYAAYYDNDDVGSERYNAYPPRVKAGDTILVHKGLHKDRWDIYWTISQPAPAPKNRRQCCGTTFDGTYYLTAKGTAEKPIVIKAAGDGEVIFDGGGNHNLFNVMGGDYNYFEGITFRNTDVAILAGQKNIAGSVGLTVKNSKFYDVGIGISTDWAGSRNYYIADNSFVGRNDPNVLVPMALGGDYRRNGAITEAMTRNIAFAAIKIYGSGHVVAYNSFRDFHDGISHSIFGLPDGYPDMVMDHRPVSNDYYNNDISNMHDDCFEIDGQLYNIRLLRNRCTNAAGSAFSTQPLFAGPAYVVRNVVYHTPSGSGIIKFAGASGLLLYNNTFLSDVRPTAIGAISNFHFRNNLIMAETPTEGAFGLWTFTDYTSSDYNGFMAGAQAKTQFVWRAPPKGPSVSYVPKPGADVRYPEIASASGRKTPAQLASENLVQQDFANLADFSKATGNDTHSIMVNYGIFENMRPTTPREPWILYDPTKLDFRVKASANSVDAGTVLPGITDGFSGKAPDLGAYEVGAPVPHYGPRTGAARTGD